MVAFNVFQRDTSAHLDEYNATVGYWTPTQIVSLSTAAFLSISSMVALILIERRIGRSGRHRQRSRRPRACATL
jgi:hypothetical protein